LLTLTAACDTPGGSFVDTSIADAIADTTPVGTCTDGARNGNESDVDCGGRCGPCASGLACGVPFDCASGSCIGGTCQAPATCGDALLTVGETDIDCGGPCAPCASGKTCGVDQDCLTRACDFGVCRDPSCVDLRTNQGESDTDCGGPCPACADGLVCQASGDCQNDCVDGRCCVANRCGGCGPLPIEICDGIDNDCDGITDLPATLGDPPLCENQVGVCANAIATCRSGAYTCTATDYQGPTGAYEVNESRCDGLDNDCDGLTDEGTTNACGTCGPAPSEVCDGLDNDCDGQTDEGTTNACGTCGPPPVESCNGRDDDCNGQTDESAACAACTATLSLGSLMYSASGDAGWSAVPNTLTVDHEGNGYAIYRTAYDWTLFRLDTSGRTEIGAGYDAGPSAIGATQSGVMIADWRPDVAHWRVSRRDPSGQVTQSWNAISALPSGQPALGVDWGSGNATLIVTAPRGDLLDGNDKRLYRSTLTGSSWSFAASLSDRADQFATVTMTSAGPFTAWHQASLASQGSFWTAWGDRPLASRRSGIAWPSFYASGADGRVHVLEQTSDGLRYSVGTLGASGSGTWSAPTSVPGAPLGARLGLGVLPSGEPIVTMIVARSIGADLVARVLRQGTWREANLGFVGTPADVVHTQVDRFGRVHGLMVTDDGFDTDAYTFLACVPL
jgi:hypothetical protein